MIEFDEYKKTIENSICQYKYLYDGDVISSNDHKYSLDLTHSIISPSLYIECINDIYTKSIDSLFSRCIEVVITYNGSNFNNYLSKIGDNNFKPSSIFCSKNGLSMFGYLSKIRSKIPYNTDIPHIARFNGGNIYHSSQIVDDVDDVCIYLVDKSIQSLVYSIQNMDYSINRDGDVYRHTINYKFYNCDFKCYKINIKSISSLREYKINKLLDDNRL